MPPAISDYFNEYVFTPDVARTYLHASICKKLLSPASYTDGISREDAQHIANALKLWAVKNGATHYTHWFQPLTGNTAMKYDAFLTRTSDGRYIEDFSADTLIQQESDASSLPNGGLRSTFEARGYTAWDPSSPPFILERPTGKTLCIPTIFIAYTGESLDYKTPLLRALNTLKKEALALARLLDPHITDIIPTLGWEQEYFLIERSLCLSRKDIIFTGRTLLGAPPPKGQQLNDHYFANIPAKVYDFMQDFERTAYRLGIPLKTRHNEVAPCQFECAPIYEEVNIAVDHNILLMDIMRDTAKKYGLKVLFHEKPFKNVNGSGKHCNWSLGSNRGNLLAPGSTPKSNLLFLSYFTSVIKAVNDHADILRMVTASDGNDLRLGAHEAPPAIISVFVGDALSALLAEIVHWDTQRTTAKNTQELSVRLQHCLPEIQRHNTDRNRTSPFAFTGDKFEFRSPGASANCAATMIALNGIVADSIRDFRASVQRFMEEGRSKEAAIMGVVKRHILHSKNILFEGDGYTKEWATEAKKRGLPIHNTAPDALHIWKAEKTKALFTRTGIFTEIELHARYEIALTHYTHRVGIELRLLEDLLTTNVFPSVIAYQNMLLKNIQGMQCLKETPSNTMPAASVLATISQHLCEAHRLLEELRVLREESAHLPLPKKAQQTAHSLRPLAQSIRTHIDTLETLIPDTYWQLPKYDRLLYLS